MIVLWLLVLLASKFYCVLSNECPVSSTLLNLSRFFTYPVDIYGSFSTNKSSELSEDTFPCTSLETFTDNRKIYNHTCSSSLNICPITKNNIQLALKRNLNLTVTANTGFCHLFSELESRKGKVRMITLGGSMTIGAGTAGRLSLF